MDYPDIFDKSIYIKEVKENEKLSDSQKKCMIKIINNSYRVILCIISENIIFYIGKTRTNDQYYCIYIINDAYFIKKYLEHNDTINVFYNFITGDDILFDITRSRIHTFQNNYHNYHKLCKDVLIKYSENENILSLFSIDFCYSEKICETIQQNITNELMDANIIIDYDARDNIFKLVSSKFINCDIDDILHYIFGFIPKAMQFSFID